MSGTIGRAWTTAFGLTVWFFVGMAFGAHNEVFESDAPESVEQQLKQIGFQQGSKVLDVGVFYGSSLVGLEFEIGLHKLMGMELGVGFLGANAGMNVHILSNRHTDLHLHTVADYMPGLQTVLPEVSLGTRFYFGQKAKVGLGLRAGLAVCTIRKTLKVGGQTLEYKPGMAMLSYAIGIPIKL